MLDLGAWIGRPVADAGDGVYLVYSLVIAASTFVFAWLLWRYVEEPARNTMRAMVTPPATPPPTRDQVPAAR